MSLRAFLLLLLILPGLALGPGWSLRLCPQRVLGTEGCCSVTVESSCCANDLPAGEPVLEPPYDAASPCGACCIVIETPAGRSAPTPEPPTKGLERALSVAAHDCVPLLAVRVPAAPASSHLLPAPPLAPWGRCTPLPLRI